MQDGRPQLALAILGASWRRVGEEGPHGGGAGDVLQPPTGRGGILPQVASQAL